MLCKDCEHFKFISEPFGYEWGEAKCLKYNVSKDFKNHGQLEELKCIGKEESCEHCKHYHKLKHNFEVGKGYVESHCCDVLLSDGWVQEVYPWDMCEMFVRGE